MKGKVYNISDYIECVQNASPKMKVNVNITNIQTFTIRLILLHSINSTEFSQGHM